MVSDSKADSILTALGREVIKTFSVYDGSDRLIERYEALSNAENNSPCLKTEYEYDGVSTRVLKSKESEAAWNSSWDI